MKKIPNIAEIIDSYSKQEQALHESAAELGAMIVEMERGGHRYGTHKRRIAELKKIAVLQEILVRRLLDNSIKKSEQPNRPHLTVVK